MNFSIDKREVKERTIKIENLFKNEQRGRVLNDKHLLIEFLKLLGL